MNATGVFKDNSDIVCSGCDANENTTDAAKFGGTQVHKYSCAATAAVLADAVAAADTPSQAWSNVAVTWKPNKFNTARTTIQGGFTAEESSQAERQVYYRMMSSSLATTSQFRIYSKFDSTEKHGL